MGAVTGMFMTGYGVVRSIAEFFREPTEGFMGLLTFGISMGRTMAVDSDDSGGFRALIVWSGRQPVHLSAVLEPANFLKVAFCTGTPECLHKQDASHNCNQMR